MKISISYSQEEKKYVTLIADRVRKAGHEVWFEARSLCAVDNLIQKDQCRS